MSKSLGNFYTVNDLLKDWPGETIRYALLSGHYRAPLNYSIKGLSDAQAALDRLYQAIGISEDNVHNNALPGVSVLDALADDLNTPLPCLNCTNWQVPSTKQVITRSKIK